MNNMKINDSFIKNDENIRHKTNVDIIVGFLFNVDILSFN